MAKTLITDSEQGTEVPFLRGILTRSLQEAGLSFEDAYRLASQVRGDLRDTARISARDLQAVVLKHLRQGFPKDVSVRYRDRRARAGSIMVEERDGQLSPFSRAAHQQRLEGCGLASDLSSAASQWLFRHLYDEGISSVSTDYLGRLTHAYLEREVGDWAAQRYLIWTRFVRSGRPLVVLIGGTAGCGKSTAATAVADRLSIVRTQSTDMLREIMRVMIPQRLLPVLHRSSFDAWRGLPGHEEDDACTDDVLAAAYHAQADLLSVACEAVAQRAVREHVSLVLEGVHINPALVERIDLDANAVVVSVMLAVLNPDQLRRRIRGRGRDVPQRRAERYLRDFDAIWRLQSLLLDEADLHQVPIIRSEDVGQVFQELMRIIVGKLAPDTPPRVEDVFSAGEEEPRAHSQL